METISKDIKGFKNTVNQLGLNSHFRVESSTQQQQNIRHLSVYTEHLLRPYSEPQNKPQ